MRPSPLSVVSVLVLTLLASDGLAQIHSPGARTLFARNFLYRSGWRFHELEGSQKRELVWENTFVYGVARNLMAVGVVPVASASGSGTSVGDPAFIVQYDGLYQKNRAAGFTRVAGFFGVRPAISSEETRVFPGVIVTHATSRWFLNGDFQWTARSDLPDVWLADASVMYRLLAYPEQKDLFLVLELNSAHERSGGDLYFLSPGVELFLRPNVALEASVQVPLHEGGAPVWFAGVRFIR